jgi:sugar (pentulose or hexulose) kinase
MLLKDYIVYRLTGKKTADMSIATFSFYFDIYGKCYWQEMLQAIGITDNQLPELIEPCTVVGGLTEQVARATGLTTETVVNTGTLDHFAGMIGTGNTAPGGMNLSTGTTMVPLARRIPLEEAKEKYEAFRGETINIRGRSERHYRMLIESYSNGYEEVEGYPMEQTILRLGDLAIVTTPYELFSELGLRVKKDSPAPFTLLLSNTNGSESYYASESEICRGGYEIDMFVTHYLQPPVPNADWHYVTQTLANLKKSEE